MRGMIRRVWMTVLFAGSLGAGVSVNAALAGAQEEEPEWSQCWTYDGDLCPECCEYCVTKCLGDEYICCPLIIDQE